MKRELGIIGADFGHSPLTRTVIAHYIGNDVRIVNIEDAPQEIQYQPEIVFPIKPLALPLIETAFIPDRRPSKHHCNRNPKPRRNKAQAKSRRANRK